MKGIQHLALSLAACLAVATAPAQTSPFEFAEHTPGYQHNADGQRDYDNGHYFSARHRFRRAAWWGDKLGQYNLGVIYYRGDGVERDPARAWAWFALAAERGYPEFEQMWEATWHELDEDGRERAREILAELEPRYSDRVAVPRTAEHMRRERNDMVGSNTGFIRNIRVIDRSGFSHDGEDYFRAEKWDFEQIVELETRLFNLLASGRVELGDLEFIEEDSGPVDDDQD